MQIMHVRPSRTYSYEHQFHQARVSPCFVNFREATGDALRKALRKERLERFISVIYRPDVELYSHCAQAEVSAQFDAFVWFDTTRAVRAIGRRRAGAKRPRHSRSASEVRWCPQGHLNRMENHAAQSSLLQH